MIGTRVICDGVAGTVVEATPFRVRVEFDDGTWINLIQGERDRPSAMKLAGIRGWKAIRSGRLLK